MIRYCLTIFLSAFLLFEVQPLAGKYILPWFGGTPAVWTTCMLLFQALLLVGYAYAHALAAWLTPRRQAAVHIVLLAASVVALLTGWLPLVPAPSWKPVDSSEPVGRILLLLACTVGLPYFSLSATAPLLQSWFSRTAPGSSPYRLYALSNTGSLLALLSYPLVVEPLWPVATQAWLWSLGYACFAACCAWCALSLAWVGRGATSLPAALPEIAHDSAASHPGKWMLCLWLTLSAIGSALLLATTNQMCQEVAVIPFLWVLPLALYLISFIIAFENPRWYRREIFGVLLAVGAIGAVYALDKGITLDIRRQVAIYSLAMFAGVMVCHGELARLKPDARHLTLFYLLVAAGGVLGGVLVALVAPLVFDDYWEYHISLGISCMLVVAMLVRDRIAGVRKEPINWAWRMLGICYCAVVATLVTVAMDVDRGSLASTRSFYGVLRLKEFQEEDVPPYYSLTHGRTQHGTQFVEKDKHRLPTTYYGPDSGVGIALNRHPRRSAGKPEDGGLRIGMVGLGAGTIACYAGEHDTLCFYEINPDVVSFVGHPFTYLTDAPRRPEIVLGDARIQLERELAEGRPRRFDVLAVDAFSSDSIPLHLLTLECFEIYWKHMADDGLLAVHVSNRALDLAPVVRGLAEKTGKQALHIYHIVAQDRDTFDADRALGVSTSDWIIVTNNQEFVDSPVVKKVVEDWPADARKPFIWTDDHASVLQALEDWRRPGSSR